MLLPVWAHRMNARQDQDQQLLPRTTEDQWDVLAKRARQLFSTM